MSPYGQNPNPYAPPQQPVGYPQAPYAPAQSGYEFNAAENRIIGAAATWLTVVAVIEFLVAASNVLSKSWVGVGLHAVYGALLFTAGTAFRSVVNTQGNDIGYLMKALDSLSQVFLIRIICFVIGAVVLGLVFGVIALIAASGGVH